MRTIADRMRHALVFEIIGLAIILPLGALLFGHGIDELGPLAIAGSLIATGWVFVYNQLFDHLLLRWRGHTRKGVALRVLHAVLFETGLLLILLPIIALALGVSLLEAFLMDAFLAVFYVVYAFVFNALYDRFLPSGERTASSRHGSGRACATRSCHASGCGTRD